MEPKWSSIDGNEAAARIAYALSEVIAIYPITPASPMGEVADDWAAAGKPNLWGAVPEVIEMQSEAGAAGVLHGALQKGAFTTTFTASQGLLLMIPNMFKIAGELTPAVMHVAARAVATHALSIFGDHSDVMAARTTGWAMLASASVQEAHDLALISHAATLRARVPFLHFFDGFRTSHEIAKIKLLDDDDIRALLRDADLLDFRARGLTPDAPVLRGTAQNPDVFFQGREAANPFYLATPGIVEDCMEAFARRTGRRYHTVDYEGAPDAERVVVIMGSGVGAAQEAVETMRAAGERVGLLTVRLYRPFPAEQLVAALPRTVRGIAVLDRTKEPGSVGEPLYLDVVAALSECMTLSPRPLEQTPRVIGGRYGLSSKEFTPAMVAAVLGELAAREPKRHFTVGIRDDVTELSLATDPDFGVRRAKTEVQALFFGLGSDGTVGANKSSIKIIGENTDLWVQGYFVYDSKKAGSVTVSHLRFGPQPIRSTYLITDADFVACHQFGLLENMTVLDYAKPDATFLLNSPYGADGGVGPSASPCPAAAHRQAPAVLGHRCRPDCSRGRPGQPHQHGDAALFLRALRGASRAGGDRPDQGVCREDLRKARAGHRRAQLRRHRSISCGTDPRRSARAGYKRTGRQKRRSLTMRRSSCNASRRGSWPARVICCRSAPCRWTAPSRPARPSTRSARSPGSCRSGTPRSASSAANARLSARTR